MDPLDAIINTFQTGKPKEALAELQALVDKLKQDAPADLTTDHYDVLGQFRNFLGDADGAVDAYLEGVALVEQKRAADGRFPDEVVGSFINLNLKIAKLAHRQGNEGSGVIHKKNSVCYGPTKTKSDEEEDAWKKERFERAIKAYKAAIDLLSNDAEDAEYKEQFRTQLAACYFDMKDFKSAIQLYDDAFAADNNAKWLYKAAECLWGQGQHDAAFKKLEQVVSIQNNFSAAYDLMAKYYKERHETEKEEELKKKHKFYAWIPAFAKHIQYNDENAAIVKELNGDNALQVVQTTLANDSSQKASEFLAAICWHHYHGPPETKSFELLEKRAATDEYIADLLIELLSNHQSVCTVKGAVSALAGIKHPRAFEFLQRLLPQDVQMFPMHIPEAIGKLGDPRGIKLLLNVLASAYDAPQGGGEDSDSDDEIFASIGKDRLYSEACLALVQFKDDEEARKALNDGLENEQLRDACQAALYEITNDEQYLEPLLEKLKEGKRIDIYVEYYLVDHDKSGKFKAAVQAKKVAEAEREEKQRTADELGVENWEPSEKQLGDFTEKKSINMSHCKAQKLHPTLFTLEDITEVELCDNRLTSLPVELASFTNLKKLNLQANRLAGTLDEAIGLFTSLEELGFHGNKLEELPESIGNLTNLKKLTLSCNQLKSVPDSIGNLTNLDTIYLDRNEITSLPSSFGNLTKLTRVDVAGNQLTSLPAELNKLVNVESIFAYGNQLTSLPDLSALSLLTLLNVSENPLKELPQNLPQKCKIYSDLNKDEDQ